jgi:predicted NAD-dependent protein-ADP-ribosyltransferase YbiA (DUF1768 family)
VKSEKRRTRGKAARFLHFANVWQKYGDFAKHWQNAVFALDGEGDGVGKCLRGFP